MYEDQFGEQTFHSPLFFVRSSRSRAFRYGLPSCMSVKTTQGAGAVWEEARKYLNDLTKHQGTVNSLNAPEQYFPDEMFVYRYFTKLKLDLCNKLLREKKITLKRPKLRQRSRRFLCFRRFVHHLPLQQSGNIYQSSE